jgi:LPXTG-motif cell wall-anchored protein
MRLPRSRLLTSVAVVAGLVALPTSTLAATPITATTPTPPAGSTPVATSTAATTPTAATPAAGSTPTAATAPTSATTSTATTTPTPAGPIAPVKLLATPSAPQVGQQVRLSVAGPPPTATGFAWDLAGHGVFQRLTGTSPQTDVTFGSPGTHPVGVRFTVGGRTVLGVLTIAVSPRPARARSVRGSALRIDLRGSATRHGPRGPATPVNDSPARAGAHARIAGDPGVTIADFQFSPGTTTIHAGDTITWTNNGPSSHSATAKDGSFNTGVLKKGASASHTFASAGTFAYVCEIHPFMHGTIVVLAAATSTQTSTTPTTPTTPAAGASTTASSTDTSTDTGATLPNTGFNMLAGFVAGLLLLGAGMALRRAR